MADTERSTRIWEGVRIVEETNKVTGDIKLFYNDTLIASSTEQYDYEWRFTDKKSVVTGYNNIRESQDLERLTEEEFDDFWETQGIPVFNNDRAAVLNNNSTDSDRELFYEAGIIGTVDPNTGNVVRSDGTKSTIPPTGEEAETDDSGFDPEGEYDPFPDGIEGIFPQQLTGQLRYPLNMAEAKDMDYLMIQALKYAPSLDIKTGNISGSERFDELPPIGPMMFLPIQPNVETQNSIDWGAGAMNFYEAKLAGALVQGMENVAAGDFGKALTDATTSVQDALNNGETKKALQILMAQKALGINIGARAFGAVINPNLEMLFNGPRLRSFNLNYLMVPREPKEAEEIRKIIWTLKVNSAPQRTAGKVFLKTPNVFRLKYVYGKSGNQHPWLNKFKVCALPNISVNMTPANSYNTMADGSMSAYAMSLQFAEISPIYADDYKDWNQMEY